MGWPCARRARPPRRLSAAGDAAGAGQRSRSPSRAASLRCFRSRCSMSPISTASRAAGATRPAARARRGAAGRRDFGSTTARARATPRSASPAARHATLVIGTREPRRRRRPRRAARAAARPLRAVARFPRRSLRGPAGAARRGAALAGARHRHDARPRRQRRGAGPRNASPTSSRGPAARRVYAAGGVRNRADLEALRAAGAAGALVATALHAGTIKAGDLVEIAGLLMSSHERGQSRTARRRLYPFQRPESSLPNRCSRPPFIGGALSCCGRFPLQVFAPNGC